MRVNKELGSFRSFHPCFPSIERLKASKLQNPKPPKDLCMVSLSQLGLILYFRYMLIVYSINCGYNMNKTTFLKKITRMFHVSCHAFHDV